MMIMMMTTVMIQNFWLWRIKFRSFFQMKMFRQLSGLQWKTNCSTIVKISGHKLLLTRNEWIEFICSLFFRYIFFDSPKFFFFIPIAAQYHGNKGFYRAKNFIRGIGKINSIQSFPEQTMEISLFAVWLDVCLVGFHFKKNH